MIKSKVIRTIIESCLEPGPPGTEARVRSGRRSPAAGGGLAGAVPPDGAKSRKAALRDPRLGQSLDVRRAARHGSKRS